jgi:hypothetical protein
MQQREKEAKKETLLKTTASELTYAAEMTLHPGQQDAQQLLTGP